MERKARPPFSSLRTCLIVWLIGVAGCASLERAHDLQRASELETEALREFQDGQYAKGIPSAREALGLRQRALGPEHPDVAASLQLLATLTRYQGRYAEAEPLYERSAAIREKAFGPSSGSVAESLNHLALLYDAMGRHEEAAELHERSLRIREALLGAEHADVAQSLNNLGLSRQAAGDYSAARPLLERALAIWERALGPNHPDLASGLNNLALLLHETGDYGEARARLERALKIWEGQLGPSHPEVGQGLHNLAVVLQSTSDYAGARPLLERALRIRRQALGGAHPAVAQSLSSLGTLAWYSGDYGQARRLLEQALGVWEQALGPEHPHVAVGLHNLARVLESSGDLTAARPYYERALAIHERTVGADHPNTAFTVHRLARLEHAGGSYATARHLYERALRIREGRLGPTHPLVALSLANLADLFRDRGEPAIAEPLYERALEIARRADAPEWEWRAAFGLGVIYERQGRLTGALALYRDAVQTLQGLAGQFGEEESRVRYLLGEDRLGVYDALARVLLRLHEQDPTRGYAREAWAALEVKKGRIAAEALTAARPRFQNPAAQRVQARQDQALAAAKALHEEQAKAPEDQRPERVRSLTTRRARTKAEYLAEVQAFLARYPEQKGRFVEQQVLDPRALAKFVDRLPGGTVAVQYFAAPDRLYLFVVAPGGGFQVLSQEVSQRELYELIKAYRQQIERAAARPLPWNDDGSPAYQDEVAPLKATTRSLAAHLLSPIEAELRNYKHLILIPNDLLLYLPLHALTLEQPDGSLRFLAETHTVSYLTQLELVNLLAPNAPVPDTPLLAMANPDGSLPGASQEIRILARVRPSVTALEGPQATKARILSLAPEFPDLHFATHGVLDLERPHGSYLLMAGEEETSQRLTIGEIEGLSLRNGLVVLSACETALGELVAGAALITLAAAFSQAGAQSIVASLWKVDDEATRDFMVSFHRALPKAGPAAALQEAQMAVLGNARTAHPYYWAAFVLIGAR